MDPATVETNSLLWRALLAYVLLVAALLPHNGGLGPLAVPPFVACGYLLYDTTRRLPSLRSQAPLTLSQRRWRFLLVPLALLSVVRPPGISLHEEAPLWAFALHTAALLGLALHGVRPHLGRWQRDLVAAAMLLIVLVAGAAVLHDSPTPRIDVFDLQQRGAAHLLAGRDPYAQLYPNFYSPAETLAFFGAPLTQLRNYPYPPLSLLTTTAAFWLSGDVRSLYLGLHVVTGLFLYGLLRRRAGSTAIGILALHLLNPRGLFLLEQSWTEPLLSAATAAWAFYAIRRAATPQRGWLGEAVLLALVLSAKQYSVVLLPLVLAPQLQPGSSTRRRLLVTGLAATLAALLLVPFLLWHPRDFIEDVVLFQLRQPFRPDALTLPALVHFCTGLRAPGALALLGLAASLYYAWPRLPRSYAGLLYGAVLGCFGFFALAKQAFCNYYCFVAVLLLLTAAATVAAPAPAERAGGSTA